MVKLTAHQNHTIAVVSASANMLSLIGTSAAIFAFIKLRKVVLTSFINHLALCIAVCDFFSALWYAIVAIINAEGAYLPESLCQFQGFFQELSYSAANFWTLVFATETFLQVIKGSTLRHRAKEIHLVVWGVSLLFAIIPFIAQPWVQYDLAGSVCWIKELDYPPLGRFVLLYIEVYIIMIIISVQYGKIAFFIYKVSKKSPKSYGKHRTGFSTLIKISLIPIVYVCMWLPASINRIQIAADPTNPVYGLTIAHVFCNSIIGFFNAIVYGLLLNFNRVVDFLKEQKLPKASNHSSSSGENEGHTVEIGSLQESSQQSSDISSCVIGLGSDGADDADGDMHTSTETTDATTEHEQDIHISVAVVIPPNV